MLTKSKFLRIASVLSYIASFIYFVLFAIFYSLQEYVFIMFLIFGVVSLYSGIEASSEIHLLPMDSKGKKRQLINTIVSVIPLLPLLFNILAITYNREDKYITTLNPKYEAWTPKGEDDRKFYKKPSFFVAIISLSMILLSGLSGHLFETSGGSVIVSDFTLNKQMTEVYCSTELNGKTHVIENDELTYGVTIYKPKAATETEKAPVIFVMPGFTRTKATMSQYCIEFSKRGAVVFCIDPGCQGATTYAGYDDNGDMISATTEANGLNYLVHYVYNNTDDFPYIDRDRFGAIGHSAGGGNVVTTAAEFAGASYEQSIIKSLYISGYIKVSAANKYKNLHCNAAQSYAYYDEGAFRYQTSQSALEVINLRFINEVAGTSNSFDEVTYDYAYGNVNDGTYRIVHREMTNHCFEMYDATSIINSISFFRETLKTNNNVYDGSLSWLGKELSNGIALLSGFVLITALVPLILMIPFFKSVKGRKLVQVGNDFVGVHRDGRLSVTDMKKQEQSKKGTIPSRFSFTGKTIFWSTTLLGSLIACFDFIPLARLSMDVFSDAANNIYTFFFPARMMNAVLLWAVVNGLIGLLLFFGVMCLENLIEMIVAKKQHRDPYYDWSKLKPLKINFVDLLKTLLVALILFVIFYGMVYLSSALFHQDFRFMLISASTIQPRYFVTWLMYFPLFFIFYISNSIKVNCSIGLEDWAEWKVYLVGAISNSIALVFILLINYASFFLTGEVFYGYFGSPQQEVWLYINMVFPLVVLMFVLPILNRIFFKFTNRAYLGAIVICMIFIMMSLTASVSYIPM